jgi:hypothetical protein
MPWRPLNKNVSFVFMGGVVKKSDCCEIVVRYFGEVYGWDRAKIIGLLKTDMVVRREFVRYCHWLWGHKKRKKDAGEDIVLVFDCSRGNLRPVAFPFVLWLKCFHFQGVD